MGTGSVHSHKALLRCPRRRNAVGATPPLLFASRLNAPNIRPGAARFLTPSSCGLLTEGADLCPHIKSEASGMSPGALKG